MFEKIHFNFQAYFISRNLQIKGKKNVFLGVVYGQISHKYI